MENAACCKAGDCVMITKVFSVFIKNMLKKGLKILDRDCTIQRWRGN